MALRIGVRRASEADVEGLVKLIARLKELNSELDPQFLPGEDLEANVRSYVEESLKRDNVVFLVAEDEAEGRLVGVLRLEVVDRRFYKPRYKAVITDLYVHPTYRGKRIGKLLIERAAEEARARGAGLLTVVYPVGNVIADRFYDRMGFRDLQKERYLPL